MEYVSMIKAIYLRIYFWLIQEKFGCEHIATFGSNVERSFAVDVLVTLHVYVGKHVKKRLVFVNLCRVFAKSED